MPVSAASASRRRRRIRASSSGSTSRVPTAPSSAAASARCASPSASGWPAEAPAEADCVVAVPDSGNFAASGYARPVGIPLDLGLIRNHYVGRTFIAPEQATRDFRARIKYNVYAPAGARPPHRAGRRLARARHDDAGVDAHAARRRRARDPLRISRAAAAARLLLRCRHPGPAPARCGGPRRAEIARAARRRQPGLPVARRRRATLRQPTGACATAALSGRYPVRRAGGKPLEIGCRFW